jgi:hypothetical protein
MESYWDVSVGTPDLPRLMVRLKLLTMDTVTVVVHDDDEHLATGDGLRNN